MSKLTEQELQDLKIFRQEANRLAAVLGEIHFQKTLLNAELEGIEAGVRANAKAQQETLKKLGEKYGDGTINFETGEILPIPTSQQ